MELAARPGNKHSIMSVAVYFFLGPGFAGPERAETGAARANTTSGYWWPCRRAIWRFGRRWLGRGGRSRWILRGLCDKASKKTKPEILSDFGRASRAKGEARWFYKVGVLVINRRLV